MAACYKEYDIASYRLRYKGTYSVLQNQVTKEKCVVFVQDFTDQNILAIDNPNRLMREYPREIFAPMYYFVPSGFYRDLFNDKLSFAIVRNMERSYSVGVGRQYSLDQMNPKPGMEFLGRFSIPNILSPIVPDVEKALKSWGPISKKLYISKRGVYYLNRKVGTREKNNFVVEPIFKSEITDCLRGHQCLVTL